MLPLLAAVVLLDRRGGRWSWLAWATALLIKSQATLLAPLLFLGTLGRYGCRWLVRGASLAVGVLLAGWAPLVLAGQAPGLAGAYTGSVERFPRTGVAAYNLWLLLLSSESTRDTEPWWLGLSYRSAGLLLLAGACEIGSRLSGCNMRAPFGYCILPGANAPAYSSRPERRVTESYTHMSQEHTDFAQAKEVATLGGGCFWCLEAVFDDLKGVEDVVSGYSGGQVRNPSYRQVCDGNTGHAEVVQVTFDPAVVSFKEILEVFFTIHDPTTLNRQGADVGTQYRSAIFYHTPEQQATAGQVIDELNTARIWSKPIVTEVTPLEVFYPAEDYHQEYFERNGGQPYCQFVIAPKVAKFRKQYLERLKK
jgi:peptide-methionine (S)-S-oxide reductase